MSDATIKVKRKTGRPATGVDPLVAFRSPPSLTEKIDEFASARSVKRSAAIRLLVEKGLATGS
jgi:hypothetical protein